MDWNKEEKEKMLASAFPFWEKLTKDQQNRMLQGVIGNHYVKGTMLHYGGKECAGVQIIYSGQARVFVTSAGGGEITLFRLLDVYKRQDQYAGRRFVRTGAADDH